MDDEIGLEVFVPPFTDLVQSELCEKHAEGLAGARAALAAGQAGLDEPAVPHPRLAVSLIIIALVAIGLVAEIRQLSRPVGPGSAPRWTGGTT
ncbi:MAG: hypothetical protein ACE5HU_03685 [Acidobacteriota bacterium]